MATIKEVAREAGVTHAVVSRILNEDPTLHVRPDTRERVLAAAAQLKYIPNHAAKALRGARAGAIGLAVHEVSNPIYSAIIEGAQRAVSAHGSVLMLADADELYRDPATFSRMITSKAIDGLILLPAGTEADEFVARAAAASLPTVVVNERAAGQRSVSVDDAAAAGLAVQHLVGLGHRDIGVLLLDGETRRRLDRREGHETALRDAGLDLHDSWVGNGGHTLESGRVGLLRMADRGPLPTSVVVHNVMAAVGVIRAAKELGLSVPHELSVIGFHDMSFADFVSPSLTVVKLALAEMGVAAVETLMRLLAGQEVDQTISVLEPAPALVIRESTAPPPHRPDVPAEARSGGGTDAE
ncbi:LacI family DNA-binding transcriptional regulator [Saxibacter everestensis]|uniref:LacI family DNA-binding transcriptional regulator n=1 Tax=Saxibacter everestensis TaxID=2909229 RepID=A0ABY8QV33_9MICO|nr:LacI family DNA-binding transcriptional regulator [Brevibacteriaceae bacterium ZFBP1038]